MNTFRPIQHPLLHHSLTILRDKATETEAFRRHASIISQLMILEATRDMKTKSAKIDTPLTNTTGFLLQDTIVFVPVLRAGIAMLSAALSLLPWASVGFIGLERDESTAIAREYYQKFPKNLDNKRILILDPMLATGGSLIDTIAKLREQQGHEIRAVCIVVAPEGVQAVAQKYPDVVVYAAAMDSHLNEAKFIVPGLGDFGDRYFGT